MCRKMIILNLLIRCRDWLIGYFLKIVLELFVDDMMVVIGRFWIGVINKYDRLFKWYRYILYFNDWFGDLNMMMLDLILNVYWGMGFLIFVYVGD